MDFKNLTKWFKRDKEEQLEISDIKDMTLLILTDKTVPNLRAYLHSQGIKVDEIYYDINDAKIGMFMQSSYCRLVIMETGLGKFTSTVMREELSDLLGICDGVEKKISVFYTDSVIKSENTEGRRNKEVDWYKFTTTVDALNIIRTYNENYITEKELVADELETYEEVMKFKGKEIEIKENSNEVKANIEGDTYDKIVDIVRESLDNEKVYAISKDRKDTGVNIECDSLPIYEVVY